MGRLRDGFSKQIQSFKRRKSSLPITADYDELFLPGKELARMMLIVAALLFLFSYVFFDSLWLWLLFLLPGFQTGWKIFAKARREKRKTKLKKEFLSAITIMGDYMRSGQSPENALAASRPELEIIWGKDAEIVTEWNRIIGGFRVGKSIEKQLAAFAERSRVDEIADFAEVFSVTKRCGGKLSDVVISTGALLSEEFYVDEKIRTMVAAKKFEQKIMDVMPVGILLYLKLASPEFTEVLYTTAVGRIVMAGCLAVYLFAVRWADRCTIIRM